MVRIEEHFLVVVRRYLKIGKIDLISAKHKTISETIYLGGCAFITAHLSESLEPLRSIV